MAADHAGAHRATAAPSGGPPTTVEEVVRSRVSHVLGGWRGSVETALPTVAFVVDWSVRHDVREAVVVSLAVAVVLAVARLVQRQTLRYVLGSLAATGIAAFFALRTGKAEAAFLPGLLNSGFWLVASVVSILARWPVVGFVVGAADPDIAEDPFKWRRNHALVRVCSRLTWVLAAMYATRLVLMVPAYVAGQVELLGLYKVVLGWPLYLAALAVMAGLILKGRTPFEPGDPHVLEDDGTPDQP